MSDFVWVFLPLKESLSISVVLCRDPLPNLPGLPQFTSAQICRGCPPPPATSLVILASQGGLQPIPVTGAFLGSTRGRNSPAADLGKLLDLLPGAQAGLQLGLPRTLRTEPLAGPPAPAAGRGPQGPWRRWAGSQPPQRPASFGSPSSSTVAVRLMANSAHDRRNLCTYLHVHIYIFRL